MAHGAFRACVLVACAAGALATFLDAAEAQTRTLTQVERDRSAADARAQRLRRQADAARGEVAALDARLVTSGVRRAEAEAAAAAADRRLAMLQFKLAANGAAYQRGRDAFEAALVGAAYAERRADIAAVRANIFARAAARPLHARLTRTAADLRSGRQLSESITQEQAVLTDAQAAIDSERADIVTLLTQRRAAQVSLTADASAAQRQAQRYAAEARTLRELTQRVAARARSAPRNSSGAARSDGLLPAAWLAPASGRITRNYGVSVAGGPPSQGIALQTRGRAQIVAPAAGEIAYAGLFRSYGQVLILNVEGGYALVFTGLETLHARTGETVRAGQAIGEMAAADTPAPELYVEVRRNGQPVNPARWLRARGLTAAEQTSGRAG